MATEKPKILIVDDEADTRSVLSMILSGETSDARISEAENGEQACLLFRVESFDLVLLDVDMPKLDGWQTLKNMREGNSSHNQDAKIVMVTGHNSVDDRKRALELGANGFVYKPFESQEIGRLLTTLGD